MLLISKILGNYPIALNKSNTDRWNTNLYVTGITKNVFLYTTMNNKNLIFKYSIYIKDEIL